MTSPDGPSGEPGRVLHLRSLSRCDHPRVSVLDRSLECDDCGATVDPLEWISSQVLARPGRIREEMGNLEAEIAELRRQRARLEAQLGRVHRRLQGLGATPLPRGLAPEVGSVAAIGAPQSPVGVHIRLFRDRFSRHDALSLASTIQDVLDGVDVG